MRERGQGNIHFPCSADPEQDWQPYPVDPYSCYVLQSICHDHTYNLKFSARYLLELERKTTPSVCLNPPTVAPRPGDIYYSLIRLLIVV